MKRSIGLFLCLAMLMMFCWNAAGEAISLDEVYQSAIEQLESYFESVPQTEETLDSVIDTFSWLQDYDDTGHSSGWYLYIQVLRSIGQNDFSTASNLMVQLRWHAEFADYLNSSEFEHSPIGSVSELNTYLCGREAENGNHLNDAMNYYEEINCFDSQERMTSIINAEESAYQTAIADMSAGNYGKAYDALSSLAEENYKDSAEVIQTLIKQYASTHSSPEISLSQQNGVVNVTWDAIADAHEYIIYRKTAETEYQEVSRTTGLEYNDIEVSEDTQYYYQVAAGILYGAMSSSVEKNIVIDVRVPELALSCNENGVSLNWNAVKDVVQYTVMRKKGTETFAAIATTSVASYVDSSAESGMNYTYKITVVTVNGASGASDEKSIETRSKAVWSAWSDWDSDEKKSSATCEVETKTQYRSREKQTTTSTNGSMSGWIKGNAISTTWGAWSGWSTSPVSASSTRQVKTKTEKQTSWGAWSDWSTSTVSASATREVDSKVEAVNTEVKTYSYKRWTYMHTSGVWWYSYAQYTGPEYAGQGKWESKTLLDPLAVIGSADGHTKYTGCWYYETINTKTKTENVTYYRYRDQITTNVTYYSYCNQVVTYAYYRYTGWTKWQDEEIQRMNNYEIDTRTVYRFRTLEE